MVSPIPDGFHTLSPHLIVTPCSEALDFYKKAFAAEERCRMDGPGGMIMHAEMKVGDSMMMLCDDFGQCSGQPSAAPGSVTLHLYVDDCDAFMKRAMKAGAVETMPVMDAFWGDRYGRLKDPYGHTWSVATHKKDMTPEEIDRAAAEWFAQHQGAGG